MRDALLLCTIHASNYAGNVEKHIITNIWNLNATISYIFRRNNTNTNIPSTISIITNPVLQTSSSSSDKSRMMNILIYVDVNWNYYKSGIIEECVVFHFTVLFPKRNMWDIMIFISILGSINKILSAAFESISNVHWKRFFLMRLWFSMV